jgi:hypothetical protein
MTPAWVEVGIGAATIVLSLAGSAFISGTRWGRVESDMKSMSDRLARIEGMFTLVYKDPHAGS